MQQYKDMINHLKDHGKKKSDRTGTGTLSSFGYQTSYDLSEGFPLLPLKKTYWKGVVHELLWFLSGNTNIQYLNENNVTIWNADAYRVYRNTTTDAVFLTEEEFIESVMEDEFMGDMFGDMGPIYGKQWRSWDVADTGTVFDQIQWIIDEIKRNPDSRRLIVSAWNVADLDEMALPPCHVMFQFYVEDGKLSCKLYQRSADLFLGVPFNVASYALLTHIIAHLTGLEVGHFIHSFGDMHLYNDHIELADIVLDRENLPLPTLEIVGNIESIDDLTFESFKLTGYEPHPTIKANVSVG